MHLFVFYLLYKTFPVPPRKLCNFSANFVLISDFPFIIEEYMPILKEPVSLHIKRINAYLHVSAAPENIFYM